MEPKEVPVVPCSRATTGASALLTKTLQGNPPSPQSAFPQPRATITDARERLETRMGRPTGGGEGGGASSLHALASLVKTVAAGRVLVEDIRAVAAVVRVRVVHVVLEDDLTTST